MTTANTWVAAGLMLVTATVGTLAPTGAAEAGHRHHHGAGIAAGAALGLLGGVIIGSALAPRYEPNYYAPAPRTYYRPAPRTYYRPARSYGADAHVAWCADRYRSYRAWDNSWVDYGGNVRNCESPYGY